MKSIPSFRDASDADLAAHVERLAEAARKAAADVLALVDECERRGLEVPEEVDVERLRSQQSE